MSGLITHFYACALDRSPAQSEVDGSVQYFASHRHDMANIAARFFQSKEYAARNHSKEEYITDLYNCLLFREPDTGGFNGGVALLASTDYSFVPLVVSTIVSQEYATAIAPRLPFLDPNWNGKIDMGEVIAAFADKHPHQAKERTAFVSTAGVSSFFDKYRLERRSGGDVIGVYYHVDGTGIYDQLSITADRVGYAGSFPIHPGSSVGRWVPMIQLSDRFITANDTGKQFLSYFDTYSSPSSSDSFTLIGSSGHNVNGIYEFGVKDFGGNIGKRWYVTFVGNLAALDVTQEYNTFDLGPADMVYDPEFSQLAYEHRHRPWVPDPDSYAYEYFGNLVDYDPHASFFNYFSF
jgi:Domain of unknown function (DUF4214)